jgi:hypothetical protein
MATRRGHIMKTTLTPREKLVSGFFHLIRGIAQQDIAAMYGINQGRVAEAIGELRTALKWPKGEEGSGDDKGE